MTRDDLLATIRDAAEEDLAGWIGACAEAQALAQVRIQAGETRATDGSEVPTEGNGNLSASEAARRLGVSKDVLYKRARDRRLPFAMHIGRRVLFDARGLERWRRRHLDS